MWRFVRGLWIARTRRTKLGRGGRPVLSRGPIVRGLIVSNAITGLIVLAIAIVWAISNGGTVSRLNTTQHALAKTQTQLVEARRFSLQMICGVLSGVAEAGQQTIATVAADTPFTRRLEALGYPPLAVRQRQAQAAARKYVQQLNALTAKSVGRPLPGLIAKNGTVNCTRFAQLSGSSRPPAHAHPPTLGG